MREFSKQIELIYVTLVSKDNLNCHVLLKKIWIKNLMKKYLSEVTFASDGQEIQINVLRISGDNFKELELKDVTFFSNDNLNFTTNLD